MKQRNIGHSGIEVGEIGLGCMGMSEFYGPTDDEASLHTLDHAYELGVTLYDTADMYGNGHNERLLSAFLRRHRDVRVASKFGIVRGETVFDRRIDNSPAYIASACDASLQRLGVDTIDLYYAHRINTEQPIEDTIGAMARLIEAGKVRAIGLSECSARTLRRAHAVHPIAAVQSEYSLWSRDPEAEVLPACRELGVSFVAYSPLGRGMLTGAISRADDLPANDYRRSSPRFVGEKFDANLRLVEIVKQLAAAKGCTPAQLALAWLLGQGDDIIPIPGTKRIARLDENIGASSIVLVEADLAAIREALPAGAASGERYPKGGQVGLNA
ncbi:aldo/keto reductase [Rhodopseudomonas sp. B29]|uniref:aldo/keto reductase n=1 Tax=Rhodopseudomonas sp. B29 TaxID=95607 RepID=UPI00034CB8F9|nr:aldo/keto reductase [Rhodopseudomonas sp. B29]